MTTQPVDNAAAKGTVTGTMSTALKSPRRTPKRTRVVSNVIALAERKSAHSPKVKTFGEMAGHHFGAVRGGPPDLSINKAYLADFGRKSMGRG